MLFFDLKDENSFFRLSFSRVACDNVSSCEMSWLPCIFVFVTLLFVCLATSASLAQESNFDVPRYHRAVEYCRGNVKRPMAFDLDNRVLCFDGQIFPKQDISFARRLENDGLFIIRSPGGDIGVAASLADLLRDRHATVVVYDYCFSACASYILMASEKAYVVKNTVVAWHYTIDPLWCPSWAIPRDEGPRRIEKSPCPDTPDEIRQEDINRRNLNRKFYLGRATDPEFDDPPESFTIRKILRNLFQETGRYPDVLWTWNPRYYASMLKTKIVYEAYPNSQAEVDEMLSKPPHFSHYHVIYDP